MSDHLCLWVDGAVGGHLYHACVPYMSECVWKRITDGLRKGCVSQLVVTFRGAYEPQLAVCESLVYFGLSGRSAAHRARVCVRLPAAPSCAPSQRDPQFLRLYLQPTVFLSASASCLSVGIHVKYTEFWQAKNAFISVEFAFYLHYR